MELSSRRDKRLEVATRRREFDEANITRKRRTEQSNVWEWWKVINLPNYLL